MTNAEPAQKIDQAFQQAVAHHQAGRFAEAEELYLGVLQVAPRHPDANHNLGLMAMQLNKAERGLPYLQVAWEADPSTGQYWLTLAECLLEMGQPEDARLLLEEAIRRGMQSPQARQLLERAKGNHDDKTQPADTNTGEAAETHTAAPSGNQPSNACSAKPDKFAQKPARHPQKSPGPQEINTLVSMYNGGRYPEAADLAQAMTERFPLHGFGWKVLGALFKQTGRNADALAAMQKAAELAPDDAEAHSNLGVTLKDLGRLNEAEAILRRALRIKPDFAEAHNNLGIALKDMGRLDEAEAGYRRALQIKPDYAEAHNNLGIVLQEMGRLDEAEASYRRALQIKPDFAEAHNNLGVTLKDLCKLSESEASYRRALQVRPDYAEAHNNLCDLLSYTGTAEDSIITYQKVFDMAPDDIGLVAAVMLAVHRYLAGEFPECRSLLSASQLIMAKTDAKFEPPRAYWNLLDLLLRRNQEANGITSPSKDIEALYVVGESHSLPAHGAVVSYRGRPMRCMAQWIVGCKQWHLGNGKANKYRYKFEQLMAGLPQRSTVLLNIGEIDCRPGEGISKVWEKSAKNSPEKSLESICHATSAAYLQYIAEIGARYGHRLVVGGVPAPNIPPGALTPEAATQHASLVRTFNVILQNLALSAKLDFLDVYTLTDCGNGVADGKWHIDTYHLLPDAVIEAFHRHCLLG